MLFSDSKVLGVFMGFQEKGLEFAADIIAPYDTSMLEKPQLGQFILIELSSIEEASLGRIVKYIPTGLLTSSEGEDYITSMQRRQRDVDEELKQQRLKYRVSIKLLGAVRVDGDEIIYVPSQRRFPHLGAKVAFPSEKVLQKICELSGGNTRLGDYVLGEFVFNGSQTITNSYFKNIDPKLPVSFDIKSLVSKRSVVFARAGYGKSNLIKYLISELYSKKQPKTDSGIPVGTLIFDADGEYFWPDTVKEPPRPGLCDVPLVSQKIAVFTNRKAPNSYYGSWKIGEVKIDIRQLPPSDVIGIAVSKDRQDQQNVIKLKFVRGSNWAELVDLIHEHHLQASDKEVGRLLGYSENQIQTSIGEITAAKSNMNAVINLLHDPNSKLLNGIITGLKEGGIVVVDISMLGSAAGEKIAGLILRKIFNYNQENFTGGGSKIIPTIAVIEEAQSVLGKKLDDQSPFVEWVKEGRKYELGSILITQQPGSLSQELLSQSDNWFSFHLLSEGDAGVLGKFNSHYSKDILAHLIGEPIPGNCYFWSAPRQPFVLPVRISNFQDLYTEFVQHDTSSIIDVELCAKIKKIAANAIDSISSQLIDKLNEKTTKFFAKGHDLYGIKDSQLFYLLKSIEGAFDVATPDSLKLPVLNTILGEGNIQTISDDVVYHCATKDAWLKAGVLSSKLTA